MPQFLLFEGTVFTSSDSGREAGHGLLSVVGSCPSLPVLPGPAGTGFCLKKRAQVSMQSRGWNKSIPASQLQWGRE